MHVPEKTQRHPDFEKKLAIYEKGMAIDTKDYHRYARAQMVAILNGKDSEGIYRSYFKGWKIEEIRELLEELDKNPLYQTYSAFQAARSAYKTVLQQERKLRGIDLDEKWS